MNCQTLSTTSSFALSSVVVFTPPAGKTITLAASTRYVVVLSENNSTSAVVDILSTQADNQNGATGWTLANVFDWKQNGTTWMKQGRGRDALIMDVKGYVNTSVPAAVSDVVVVPVRRTTDSLTISWSAPDNTGKPALTGYEFRYKMDIPGAVWTLVSHPGASTSVTVNGLDDGRLYLVEVRALNADGSGPWSVTAESPTSPPPRTVLANHPLVPDDLGPGDSFRLLHVTSGTKAATDTVITHYHDTAASDVFPLVNTGKLLGRWYEGVLLQQRALVSTAGGDARLFTDTTWTSTDLGVPIYWINGARVADDYQDFYDGTWADEANPMNGFGEPRAVGQSMVGVGAPNSSATGAGPLSGGGTFASTEERPVYGLWHVMVIGQNFRLAGNLSSAANAAEKSDERLAVRAQLFTTGPHPGGYGISDIVVWRGSDDATDASLGAVALYTTDGDGDPDLVDGLHATLSLERTASFIWFLEAPVGTVLKANTTYALVFQGADPAYPKLGTNADDGEDAVAAGWSLADVLRYHDGSNWVDNPDGYALSMDIIGPRVVNNAPTGAPTITGTPTVGQTLTAVTTAIMDDDGLTTPGYTYQWIRVATDSTETITVTDVNEPPGVPAAHLVTATSGSTTSLDVTWTAPTNTGPAITSYDLQYREGTSGSFTAGPQNVTGTSAAIASLMASTSHQVQVRATNAEGDGAWSFPGTGRTGASVPGAPTSLSATASGSTQIDLSWTAPGSDGGSSITGYKIEVSSDGGANWTVHVATTGNPATTYSHIGLAAGTTRHYRVSAINANGAGAASNTDNATTNVQTTVRFGAAAYTATEGGADATVAVVLSAAPSAPVTIPLTKAHVGGAAATDYSSVPANVTFPAGQTRQTFMLRATDDSQAEGDERVRFGFGSLPSGCRSKQTAPDDVNGSHCYYVTHPCHPLHGYRFELIRTFNSLGTIRAEFLGPDGQKVSVNICRTVSAKLCHIGVYTEYIGDYRWVFPSFGIY